MDVKEIANGLLFPEGPIAMPDGSIIVVEIARGTLSRVQADGQVEVIAKLGGGPNGAAMGPDGAVYVCNNGGFEWHEVDGCLIPSDRPANYSGGRLERVNLETGAAEVLYSACDGNPLNGPNDIVFDAHGGFYFTDLGKSYGRQQDRGAVFYARADGSMIKEIAFPMIMPNGVGLSPDEKTLYVAESATGRLWDFQLAAPGEIAKDDTVASDFLGGGGDAWPASAACSVSIHLPLILRVMSVLGLFSTAVLPRFLLLMDHRVIIRWMTLLPRTFASEAINSKPPISLFPLLDDWFRVHGPLRVYRLIF